MRLAIFSVFLLSLSTCDEEKTRKKRHFQRTRSLSGTPATDGDQAYNDELYNIMTQTLLHGFAIFKVKAYNDRVYLDRTRRSYWYGHKYYWMDNFYYLATRDTCAYRMNETERRNIHYEDDNAPIFEIYYQCQRYVDYCCGLDCCHLADLNKPTPHPHHMKYPWSYSSHSTINVFLLVLFASFCL